MGFFAIFSVGINRINSSICWRIISCFGPPLPTGPSCPTAGGSPGRSRPVVLSMVGDKLVVKVTPRKTNMSLENQWLEDVFPIEIVPF